MLYVCKLLKMAGEPCKPDSPGRIERKQLPSNQRERSVTPVSLVTFGRYRGTFWAQWSCQRHRDRQRGQISFTTSKTTTRTRMPTASKNAPENLRPSRKFFAGPVDPSMISCPSESWLSLSAIRGASTKISPAQMNSPLMTKSPSAIAQSPESVGGLSQNHNIVAANASTYTASSPNASVIQSLLRNNADHRSNL
jgi:hypothetical protein